MAASGATVALTASGLDMIKTAHATTIFSAQAPDKSAYDFLLTMVDYSDPVREAFESQIVPMFLDENPGSTVEVNWSNWGRYNEEMTTAFAAGVTPDVFQGGAVWTPQMARRRWALTLNDYIAGDDDWDWADFPAGLQADVTFNGNIVGVPYRQDLRTLWYRQDSLAAAGFDAPPTTWDEFLEVAKATTVKGDSGFEVEGYHFSDSGGNWQRDWQPYLIWLHMAGGQFLSDDLETCMLDQEPAVEALQFLYDMVHKHEVISYPGLEPQGDLEVIVAADAALAMGNADLERVINLYAPDQAESVQPALPLMGEVRATHSWVNKFFISSQTENPDRSWDLMRFLTRKDILEIYAAANNNTPPRLSLLDAPYMSEKHKQVLQAAQYARTFPQHWNLIALFRPIAAELEQCLTGNKQPAEALADATKAINQILADG
jgi:multiple sugar transport system substrate-binding protein